MTTKTYLLAMAAAGVAAGCSQVLGFKDPSVSGDDAPDIDAPTDTAMCVPSECQFGCDPNTNACRDGKLWIFKTPAAFFGNGFGGTDVPPNVRGGADGKCLVAYTASYGARQCNNNNVHAILHVSSSDSIPLMATRYSIPTNVPVQRADDEVLVANNWNDLTDPTMPLRAPATTAPAGNSAIVWTGANTVATCANWTSKLSTDSGTRGYTDRVNASWLSQDTFRCDLLFSLLCVCWSGGE
jgi:hypothetical protein